MGVIYLRASRLTGLMVFGQWVTTGGGWLSRGVKKASNTKSLLTRFSVKGTAYFEMNSFQELKCRKTDGERGL